MNIQNIEKKEKNMATFEVKVPADVFDNAVNEVYKKNKNHLYVAGFRKGKAPRAVIEGMYGKEVFYPDAIEALAEDAFEAGRADCGFECVGAPSLIDQKVTEDKELIYTFEVGMYPEVQLGQYKGLEVPQNHEAFDESKVDEEMHNVQKRNARLLDVEREAKMGDHVTIDFAGFIDGEQFDGGTAEDYDLELGSNTFVPGFEEQIVGHNPGETFDVNVTFPDGYDASTDSDGNTVELSGKEAVFRVTVNSISEPVTPELTDEWVDSTFGTSDDVHTVEELKAFFSSALYDQNLEDAIMDALLDTADFKDVPKQISDYYACMFLNYYYQLASYYSSDLDTIAQAQGYTDANAMLGASDTVITHLAKQDLLYQAIAESQGIEPTQEQLDAAAASYSGSSYGDNFVHQTALQTAVMEWLKTNAVIS